MGYALCIGDCYACGKTFSFNPVRVPSFRDKNNVRQPVCRSCMEQINRKRQKMSLEPFVIPEDAYDYCEESELD